MIIYIKTATVKYLYLKWIKHGKEYGVYNEEDDIAVAELEIYFKEIHYLLKDLDDYL